MGHKKGGNKDKALTKLLIVAAVLEIIKTLLEIVHDLIT